MICEVLTLTPTGSEVAGRIILNDDGKVTGEPLPGSEDLIANMINEPMPVDAKRVTPFNSDPARWFAALQRQYRGSYLRVRMVEEAAKVTSLESNRP
jgi:hypothetical protein